MSRIESVDHVQLPIPFGSAPRARAFYERLLGLVERRHVATERPGTLCYALGAQRLDLREGHYVGVAPQAHLALQVRDVAAIAEALQAAGVLFERAPLDGRERLCVDDPFGNRLELIETVPSPFERSHHVDRLRIAI